MPQATHDAVARGLIRYCPVCDGFEFTDKSVGVIGTGGKGFREAIFLRSYTRDLTLVSSNSVHDLSETEALSLAEHGIIVVAGPVAGSSRTMIRSALLRRRQPTHSRPYIRLSDPTHVRPWHPLSERGSQTKDVFALMVIKEPRCRDFSPLETSLPVLTRSAMPWGRQGLLPRQFGTNLASERPWCVDDHRNVAAQGI
jgi:hypothetical protein